MAVSDRTPALPPKVLIGGFSTCTTAHAALWVEPNSRAAVSRAGGTACPHAAAMGKSSAAKRSQRKDSVDPISEDEHGADSEADVASLRTDAEASAPKCAKHVQRYVRLSNLRKILPHAALECVVCACLSFLVVPLKSASSSCIFWLALVLAGARILVKLRCTANPAYG